MSTQLAQGLRAHRWLALGSLASWAAVVSFAGAHVGLDAPNGGEAFIGGSQTTIEWHVEIMHNTLDWDLWYSIESEEGPWEEIVMDLAAGDISEDAVHTFDWSVPSLEASSAWVRVRQDNEGQDYFDVSDSSFQIMSSLSSSDFTQDGSVDGDDLAVWEQGFGDTTAAMPDGDADFDTDVDGADFLAWQSQFTHDRAAQAGTSVPEPAATVMLVLGMILMLWLRR